MCACVRVQMSNGRLNRRVGVIRTPAGRDYTREQILRTAEASAKKCRVSAFSALLKWEDGRHVSTKQTRNRTAAHAHISVKCSIAVLFVLSEHIDNF